MIILREQEYNIMYAIQRFNLDILSPHSTANWANTMSINNMKCTWPTPLLSWGLVLGVTQILKFAVGVTLILSLYSTATQKHLRCVLALA